MGGGMDDGTEHWMFNAYDNYVRRMTEVATMSEIERLQHEVMHLRQRYEALRSAVEDVADLIRGAAEKARQLHVINRDPYDDGRSVGFGTAVKWLRKALPEHGGDDADGCVGAEVSDYA